MGHFTTETKTSMCAWKIRKFEEKAWLVAKKDARMAEPPSSIQASFRPWSAECIKTRPHILKILGATQSKWRVELFNSSQVPGSGLNCNFHHFERSLNNLAQWRSEWITANEYSSYNDTYDHVEQLQKRHRSRICLRNCNYITWEGNGL